jgi:hypothetical protein
MAASKVRTSAGTKFYVSDPIAALNTTYDAATFAGGTYIEVGELSDLGSFGKKYNLVTFNPLGDRKTVKRKGSYNNGTLALKLGAAVTDAGQIKMQAAADSDSSYAFKVVTQSGSIYYFTGQVMGWMLEVGSVDQIMGASTDLEIDNDIVATNLTA